MEEALSRFTGEEQWNPDGFAWDPYRLKVSHNGRASSTGTEEEGGTNAEAPSSNPSGSGGGVSPLLWGSPKATTKSSKGAGTCQVEECDKSLDDEKGYYQRYGVCERHLKMLSLMVDGRLSRFCQQCGRFHALAEFDGNKRSCRARLQQHNARRRKRVPPTKPALCEVGDVQQHSKKSSDCSGAACLQDEKMLEASVIKVANNRNIPDQYTAGSMFDQLGQHGGSVTGFKPSHVGQPPRQLFGLSFDDPSLNVSHQRVFSMHSQPPQPELNFHAAKNTLGDRDMMHLLNQQMLNSAADQLPASHGCLPGSYQAANDSNSWMMDAPSTMDLGMGPDMHRLGQAPMRQPGLSGGPYSFTGGLEGLSNISAPSGYPGSSTLSGYPGASNSSYQTASNSGYPGSCNQGHHVSSSMGYPEASSTVYPGLSNAGYPGLSNANYSGAFNNSNSYHGTSQSSQLSAAAGTMSSFDIARMLVAQPTAPVPYTTEETMVRVSLKIANCTPDKLPLDLFAKLRNLLSSTDATLIQGFLRPGCTHIVLDVAMRGQGRSASELDPAVIAAVLGPKLLQHHTVVVQRDALVSVFHAGALVAQEDASAQPPCLSYVSPAACLHPDGTASFYAVGTALVQAGCKVLLRMQGGYLPVSCSPAAAEDVVAAELRAMHAAAERELAACECPLDVVMVTTHAAPGPGLAILEVQGAGGLVLSNWHAVVLTAPSHAAELQQLEARFSALRPGRFFSADVCGMQPLATAALCTDLGRVLDYVEAVRHYSILGATDDDAGDDDSCSPLSRAAAQHCLTMAQRLHVYFSAAGLVHVAHALDPVLLSLTEHVQDSAAPYDALDACVTADAVTQSRQMRLTEPHLLSTSQGRAVQGKGWVGWGSWAMQALKVMVPWVGAPSARIGTSPSSSADRQLFVRPCTAAVCH